MTIEHVRATADSSEGPVSAVLARVSGNYDVAIGEALSFDLEVPIVVEEMVSQSDLFGCVWLESDEPSEAWEASVDDPQLDYVDPDFPSE